MRFDLAASRLTYEDEAHVYRYDGNVVASVTQVLGETGMVDSTFYTPAAAQRGRFLHKMCNLYDTGRLDWKTVDDRLMPFFLGYQKFLEDTKFDIALSETPLYHPLYSYAGTLDRLGRMVVRQKTAWVLADLKTGGLHPATALQTAGYKELVLANALDFDKETPILRLAVHLPGDGTWKPMWYDDYNDKSIFLGLVGAINWKRRYL